MKGYPKNDVPNVRMAGKFRAAAAVLVFGIVGVVWLQTQAVADRWMNDSITAAGSVGYPANESMMSPDAENPSSVPTTY